MLQLGDVLSELSILLSRLLGENIELKLDQAGDLWPVKADLHQFEQVIINLAVNARDAMPEGGKLTIRTANVSEPESRELGQRHIPPGEYVLIEVSDTGTGMTPEVKHEDLRAVLLHQGGRPRHRARPVHRLRHRQADRRLHLRRERGGQRHHHARLPAAL